MRKKYLKNRTKQDWYQYHKGKSGSDSVAASPLVKSARESLQAAELKVMLFEKNKPQTLSSDLRKFFLGKNDSDRQLDQLKELVDIAKKKLSEEIAKAHSRGVDGYREDWLQRNPDKRKF